MSYDLALKELDKKKQKKTVVKMPCSCRWLPGVINVFADKSSFASIKSDKLDSFYTCVTILISNQVSEFENVLILRKCWPLLAKIPTWMANKLHNVPVEENNFSIVIHSGYSQRHVVLFVLCS